MIPKIIHYCWFGGNPLPESAKKCIASWKKYLPDYQIWQWSEKPSHDNANHNPNGLSTTHPLGEEEKNGKENDLFDKILGFDVNIIPYTQQAYEAKKYAFVSDYARFWILYKYGGLYFDTDVEIIKPMDDILERGPFMGIEKTPTSNITPMINPGLGLGATPQMDIYRQILDSFHRMEFYSEDASINPFSMIPMVTKLFSELGFKANKEVEYVAETYIYPEDVFCPMDSTTGITTFTDNTVSIHHYDCSWMDHNTLRFRIHVLKNCIYRILHKLHLK